LSLAHTQDTQNDQQGAKCKKPAPGFPDLLEASSKEIGRSSHRRSSFEHRSVRAIESEKYK